jgi:hypothetical protein
MHKEENDRGQPTSASTRRTQLREKKCKEKKRELKGQVSIEKVSKVNEKKS